MASFSLEGVMPGNWLDEGGGHDGNYLITALDGLGSAGRSRALVNDSAERAVDETLAAGYTACLCQSHLEGGTDGRCETTVVDADDTDMLYLFTDSGTTAAKHYIYCCRGSYAVHFHPARKVSSHLHIFRVIHAQLPAELHKLTVAAAHAGCAHAVMLG